MHAPHSKKNEMPFARLRVEKSKNMRRSTESDADDDEEAVFYPTEGPWIVDAETGRTTGSRVGTSAERKFWKVIDATVAAAGGMANVYFYASPEAYELAKNVTVSGDRKLNWLQRKGGRKCSCRSAHVCSE